MEQEGKAHWDRRFGIMNYEYNSYRSGPQNSWNIAGGNQQSLMFMSTAMEVLHNSDMGKSLKHLASFHYIGDNRVIGKECVIHDYGCAEGDGTAVLQSHFPFGTVTGYDISLEGVLRARKRWPTLNFEVGDITSPDCPHATLIFTSHTLEHVDDPVAAVEALRGRCDYLVVIVPPVDEVNHGGHSGSIAYKEWTSSLPVKPLFEVQYHTVRPNPEHPGEVMLEGNALMVFKGVAQ